MLTEELMHKTSSNPLPKLDFLHLESLDILSRSIVMVLRLELVVSSTNDSSHGSYQ